MIVKSRLNLNVKFKVNRYYTILHNCDSSRRTTCIYYIHIICAGFNAEPHVPPTLFSKSNLK